MDHSTVTRWFKKFSPDYKNLNDLAGFGRLKTMDSKALLQAIESNLGSSWWAWYLIVQCGLSYLQAWQKPLDMLNCAPYYPNIAKLLIHPCHTFFYLLLCLKFWFALVWLCFMAYQPLWVVLHQILFIYLYIYIYISKVGDHSRGQSKGSLSITTTPFPGLPYFTFDMYLVMLSI